MVKIIRRLVYLLVILTVCAMGVTPVMAQAQPDFQPTQIIVTAYTGITNTVTVLVKNNEDVASDNFSVKLESDNGTGYVEVGTKTGNSIYAADNEYYYDTQVKFDWTPSMSGNYTLKATVNPGGTVAETNEANNVLTDNVTVTDLAPAHVQEPVSTILGV